MSGILLRSLEKFFCQQLIEVGVLLDPRKWTIPAEVFARTLPISIPHRDISENFMSGILLRSLENAFCQQLIDVGVLCDPRKWTKPAEVFARTFPISTPQAAFLRQSGIFRLAKPVKYKFIKTTFIKKIFSSKSTFIKNHFHQKPISSKCHFHQNATFIKNHFHQKPFSSKTIFIKNHFHQKPISSETTFIKNQFQSEGPTTRAKTI